jgi:hypothetical protein
VTSEKEFTEFAVATSPRLRRAAFLLCGDKVGRAPDAIAITP